MSIPDFLPNNPYVSPLGPPHSGDVSGATMALAYEQRTTALVNLFGALIQKNSSIPRGLYTQIWDRLGLKDEDDENE